MERASAQSSLRLRTGDHRFDKWRQHLRREFAGVRTDRVSCRIYYYERRPRGHGIAAPYTKLPVVDDWMLRIQSPGCMPNAVGYPLSMIFPAMNSNYNDLGFEPFFQLPQLRKYVNAVDSPIGPEVEQEDLAPQIGQSERAVFGVYPVQVRWEIGGANRGFGGGVRGHQSKPRHLLCAEVAITGSLASMRTFLYRS